MAEYDYTQLLHCGKDVRIASSVAIRHPELVSIGSHVAIDDFCYITTSSTLDRSVASLGERGLSAPSGISRVFRRVAESSAPPTTTWAVG